MRRFGLSTIGTVAALALTLLAVSGRAEALQPLAERSHVTERLVAARVADRIRTTCPDISARYFRVLAEVNALERWARDEGYDRGTVTAFLKDKTARAGIYAQAEDYLAAHGAQPGDVQSFCRLGRAEIEARSLIGSLIRAK